MTATPLVTFVIPSYNYGRYLKECLEAALNQEGNYALEVVVVDDASTDDSVQVVRSLSDPRIRLFCHERNQGHVVTINEGFQHARGTFLARIDSDDRHRPCFLRETLTVLAKHPDVGLVHGAAALIDRNSLVTHESADAISRGDRKGDEFLALLKKNFVTAPTVIGSRRAWQSALPIPSGIGFSDWYLSLRIAKNFPLYYRDRVLADYRVHGEGLHEKMIRDRSEERTILQILQEFFADSSDARLRSARGAVYSAQFLMLAEKYFGAGMYADARRCYWQTWRHQPARLLRVGPLRRLLATFLGQRRYEFCKRLLRAPLMERGETPILRISVDPVRADPPDPRLSAFDRSGGRG